MTCEGWCSTVPGMHSLAGLGIRRATRRQRPLCQLQVKFPDGRAFPRISETVGPLVPLFVERFLDEKTNAWDRYIDCTSRSRNWCRATGKSTFSGLIIHLGNTAVKNGVPQSLSTWCASTSRASSSTTVLAYHHNASSIVPTTLKHQGIEALASLAHDPLINRTFGARLSGPGMVACGSNSIKTRRSRA